MQTETSQISGSETITTHSEPARRCRDCLALLREDESGRCRHCQIRHPERADLSGEAESGDKESRY